MDKILILCFSLLAIPSSSAHTETHPPIDKHVKHEKAPSSEKYENLQKGKTPSEVEPAIDIFPPKWVPGDIINKIDLESVNVALDDVLKAGDDYNRLIAIAIANEGSNALSGPEWALKWGLIHTTMPHEVKQGETSLNLFTKMAKNGEEEGSITGTSGILAYNINGTDLKVAVMWRMPYNTNLYDMWFNMKVYPRSVSITTDLYKHLLNLAGPWKPGYANREEFGVKVNGTMTDSHKSKLIVWINTDNMYDLHTECSYHPGWVGHYCNQECFGAGWCWVNKRCTTNADCNGRHVCYTGC